MPLPSIRIEICRCAAYINALFWYEPVVMKSQESGRFQYDCRTHQPTWTYQKSAQSGGDSIGYMQIGCTVSGTIEDQKLLFDEKRFSYDGTCAAGPHESNDCCNEMEKQYSQIAHSHIVTRLRNARNPQN